MPADVPDRHPPREPWWRDGPATQPAPSPPGRGPRVGSWTEAKWPRRRGFLALLVVMTLVWTALGLLNGRFSPFPLWVGTLLGTWLVIVWRSRPRSVAVGEDWLWLRSGKHDGWVQTDDLIKLSVWFNWTRRKLILEDRAGRRLTVDLGFLAENPVIHQAFLAAVRRSQAKGLTLNRAAANTLGLEAGGREGPTSPGG